jgi:16S rRNA (guanine966-N2)-methyltransferase
VRIIAGQLKGRRLEVPDWPGLRPTSDKLRETLFNVLSGQIAGARVLDGYAGTGAVGIEALSRGASGVVFVERDARAVRLIASNLRRCGISDRYAIIRAGLAEAATRLEPAFDIIFLDPPYAAAELATALPAAERLMSADSILIIEHARRDTAPSNYGTLIRTRDLVSGDNVLTFYRRQKEPTGGAELVSSRQEVG